MSLAVAILTAGVFALFGFPFFHYQCWFTWSPVSALLGTALYLALAGGVGGFLGWVAAEFSGASLSDNLALSGFFFGVVGALAVRADFAVGSSNKATNIGSPEVRNSLSFVREAVQWTSGLLDVRASSVASRWYRSLADDQLKAKAYRLDSHIAARDDITDEVKKIQQDELIDGMRTMNDDARRVEGRTRVVQFCSSYSIKQHLSKPGDAD
jgi:hypothetical protein